MLTSTAHGDERGYLRPPRRFLALYLREVRRLGKGPRGLSSSGSGRQRDPCPPHSTPGQVPCHRSLDTTQAKCGGRLCSISASTLSHLSDRMTAAHPHG